MKREFRESHWWVCALFLFRFTSDHARSPWKSRCCVRGQVRTPFPPQTLGSQWGGNLRKGRSGFYFLLSATSFEQHGWRLRSLALFPEAWPLPGRICTFPSADWLREKESFPWKQRSGEDITSLSRLWKGSWEGEHFSVGSRQQTASFFSHNGCSMHYLFWRLKFPRHRS